ncbi:MAG: FxLYD domain-containing protein, partial [Limisphaerales bacterium]
ARTAPVPVASEIAPAAPASTGAKLKKVFTVVWSVLVGLSVLGFFGLKAWRWYRNTESVVAAVKGGPKTEQSKPAANPPGGAPRPSPMPPPVAVPTSVVVARGTPPSRKPGEDLQLLSFEVQKAKDGDLQYIVGVVTNHAAKQYFNVKLTFDLTRQGGKTGDTATETLRNLPANVGSTFKVNVIGTTPVSSATLAKLEGEKE